MRFADGCASIYVLTVLAAVPLAAQQAKPRTPERTSVRAAVAFDLSAPLEQFIPNKTLVIHRAVESPKELQGATKGPGPGLSATAPPAPPAGRGGGGGG